MNGIAKIVQWVSPMAIVDHTWPKWFQLKMTVLHNFVNPVSPAVMLQGKPSACLPKYAKVVKAVSQAPCTPRMKYVVRLCKQCLGLFHSVMHFSEYASA
jgi:hypothetical protein